jgi:flagellar motor switch protein FliN/FliY
LTVEQLLVLAEGSLIRSERAAGDNVDVEVGGQPVGSAEIVVLGNSLGVRITDFREKN